MNVRNVIQIPRADLFDQANLHDSDIPEAIHLSRRIFLKRLKESLNTMFDNVDDCLFEYADKASNNQQQMVYFDAMREIRLQKQKMTDAFFIEYEKRFRQALNGSMDVASSSNQAGDQPGFASLSLVDEDDLELSLAIINMTSKYQSHYREALYATARRFSHVVPGIDYETENQPLSGKTLCDSFARAVESLSCDVQIKLIVFKLFDKFVVQRLMSAFDEINGMFIGKGILPVITFKSPVKSNSSMDVAEPAPDSDEFIDQFTDEQLAYAGAVSTETGLSSEHSVFSVMQQLLARNRGASGSAGANTAASLHGNPQTNGMSTSGITTQGVAAGGNGATSMQGGQAHAGARTFIVNDIISGLSNLQNHFSVYRQGGNQQGTSIDSSNDAGENNDQVSSASAVDSAQAIKVQLVEALSSENDSQDKRLSETESDVIDIVSMMFDFILDDKSLPDKLKALIAKLQIPFIKLAILDKSFFSKKSHPARQLLNELAYSDSFFEDDDTLDNEPLYAMIEEIVEKIIKEYDSDEAIFQELLDDFIEFREQELEANRMAKEMLETTKQSVAAEIEHRIRNNKMPEVIRSLLLKEWKDVMNTIGVRDGCEGIAWDAAIAVMDDLIWSVQPKLVVQEKSQLTKLIPRILNGLQDGLILIGFQQESILQLFTELEQLHHASVRGLCEVGVKHAALTSANSNDIDIEEIVLQAATDEALEFGALADVNADSQYYYVVKGMEEGTWVTFNINGRQRRGRLAWKCEFTGEYTFVDRKYKLVQDITINELIEQLESGVAVISEDIPLFDRAVDAVVKGLRQCLFSDDDQQAGAIS